MEDSHRLLSPQQLMSAFLCNIQDNAVLIDGKNPFTIDMNGDLIDVYIKNLSPAQLSNNNPDVWRIQLPVREEFEKIKGSNRLFLLLGYDFTNEVYTTWNPYWCKQRLNVGKSVSLYSRLSLQERVGITGEIEQMNLNNDSNVICIPQRKIGEYIRNIKIYYPVETEFIAKGSSIQKRINQLEMSDSSFETFKNKIKDKEAFLNFMHSSGISLNASMDYFRHVVKILNSEYIEKHKDIFLSRKSLEEYDSAIYDFLHMEDVALLDKQYHGYFRTGLRHYRDFLLTEKNILPVEKNDSHKVTDIKGTVNYTLDKFGKLEVLDSSLLPQFAKFMKEEYPDFGTMIEIVRDFYPFEIEDKMSDADWINLFENTNFKKIRVAENKKPSSSKIRTKTISVVLPDGNKIQHKFVADTYIEVIKRYFPDLIMELGIKHAGVNIVSKEFDDKYRIYQKEIDGGFLIMTNSSTEQKYQDLCQINKELDLGLKINLVDIDSTDTVTQYPIKKDGERRKIKITFPTGRIIQPDKVLDALVEVVKYAGAQKVQDLGIEVNHYNLITSTPYEKYRKACKSVNDGLYVNTASDTLTKYNQICKISNSLKLGLIVELV